MKIEKRLQKSSFFFLSFLCLLRIYVSLLVWSGFCLLTLFRFFFFYHYSCTLQDRRNVWGQGGKVPTIFWQISKPYSIRGVGGTVCWNGVLHGHFLGIKMQHWNECLSTYKISQVFEVPYRPQVKYRKFVNDTSNLTSFYSSHSDAIICVKQIGLGLARTKEILKFCENELRH